MEKAAGLPLAVSGNKVTAHISPYEILTVRVDYPNATK
jgi:alpha-mannosidase